MDIFIFLSSLSLHIVNVYSSIGGLENLDFSETGTREPTYGTTNVWRFSAETQAQICDSCSDTNCWGVQGISKYNSYVVRSLYQKGTDTDFLNGCNGKDSNGNTIATYAALSVMKASTSTESFQYSNILLETNDGCHAGDVVLRKYGEEHWFFIACTSYVAIFNETSIITETRTVNNKEFDYLVPNENIIKQSAEGVKFSYLSANHGEEYEFYAGEYEMDIGFTSGDSSLESIMNTLTVDNNLKLIKIDKSNDWSVSVITSFEFDQLTAHIGMLQGATRIDEFMFFMVTYLGIYRCSIDGNIINWCFRHCQIPNFCWQPMVLQGAETDDNGNLYIGSEFGASCDKPFFEIDNAKWDTDGVCGYEPGIPRPLGDHCSDYTDCEGNNAFGPGISCCEAKCTEKQKNYLGLWVCPSACRKEWYSWFGTCNDPSDGSCSSFSDSKNDCPQISDDWNLGIGIGDSQYAGTDSRIMFSYCVNRECSDWFALDNCDHNDFKGTCLNEYFIVPQMTEDVQNAIADDAEIDFEFVNCGSDGIQIDQIGIGHEAELINIQNFTAGDDAFCRFKDSDERSFAVDGDGEHCKTVAVSWHSGSSTTSTIYSSLISSRCSDDICRVSPGCADDANQCQVRGLTESETQPVLHRFNVLEINNKDIFIFSVFVILLLLLTLQNISKCRKYYGNNMKVESL